MNTVTCFFVMSCNKRFYDYSENLKFNPLPQSLAQGQLQNLLSSGKNENMTLLQEKVTLPFSLNCWPDPRLRDTFQGPAISMMEQDWNLTQG